MVLLVNPKSPYKSKYTSLKGKMEEMSWITFHFISFYIFATAESFRILFAFNSVVLLLPIVNLLRKLLASSVKHFQTCGGRCFFNSSLYQLHAAAEPGDSEWSVLHSAESKHRKVRQKQLSALTRTQSSRACSYRAMLSEQTRLHSERISGATKEK